MAIVLIGLMLAMSAFGSTHLQRRISTISKNSSPLFRVLENIDAVDSDGRSALHHAIMLGDLELVKLLLRHGAETRIKDNDGKLPLYYAEDLAYAEVEAGQRNSPHFAIISWVLQYMGKITRDRKSWNALHWAVLSGDSQRVEELLDFGIDATYGRYQNPLDLAFVLRDKEIFILLMEGKIKEVDLYKYSLSNVMIHMRANSWSSIPPPSLEDFETVLNWIAEVNTSFPLPNLVSVYKEDDELARLTKVAIDLGFAVDSSVEGIYGLPLILRASSHGKVLTIKTLLENGADPNAYRDYNGKNAVQLAAQEGHTDAVNILLDQTDININAVDNNKYTALMRAARNGHYQTVDALQKRGADQTLKNYQGKTALHLARIGLKSSLKSNIDNYQKTIDILKESS